MAIDGKAARAVKLDRPSANVMRITLDRPGKLNVLSLAVLKTVADALRDARDDPTIYCVTLTGTDKAFAPENTFTNT